MDTAKVRTLAADIIKEVDGVSASNKKRVPALGRIRVKAQSQILEIDTPYPAPPPIIAPPPVVTPPTSTTIRVPAGQSVQAAIDNAAPGSVIELENGVTYQGAVVVNKPLTIQPVSLPPIGRVAPSFPAPVILGPDDALTIRAADVSIIGIRAASENPDATLISDFGQRTLLDCVLAIGDPAKGQHRGVLAHGQEGIYRGCYIDNCFSFGRDAQALAGWDGTKNLLVDDCYLGGGAQSVMFGGADSASDSATPTDIIIQRSRLTKNPAWASVGAQIKTALELKCVRRFTIEDCDLEYAGVSDGQRGYLIVLTPRNQDGNAPWSEVNGVSIVNVRGRYAAGVANFLGHDEVPSGKLANVRIANSGFTDLDPQRYPGDGRLFLIGDGPDGVTIESVTVLGQNLSASLYFYGQAPTRMVVRNLVVPKSQYGMFVDGQAPGEASVRAYAPDIVLDSFVEG